VEILKNDKIFWEIDFIKDNISLDVDVDATYYNMKHVNRLTDNQSIILINAIYSFIFLYINNKNFISDIFLAVKYIITIIH